MMVALGGLQHVEGDRVVEDGPDRHAHRDIGDALCRAGISQHLVEHEVVRLAERGDHQQRDGVDVADRGRDDDGAAQVRRGPDRVAPGKAQGRAEEDREAQVGGEGPPVPEDRRVDGLCDFDERDGREQQVEADLGHGLADGLGDDALR